MWAQLWDRPPAVLAALVGVWVSTKNQGDFGSMVTWDAIGVGPSWRNWWVKRSIHVLVTQRNSLNP